MNQYIEIAKEVEDALKNSLPVVALESTIISHGMPYPKNIEMAKNCERIIRENGAIPATIAIMNGIIKIGLSDKDLNDLATSKNVFKVSRRDLSYVLANQLYGATTVTTTMICAHMVGIKFFATGGIGGVHRGYEDTLDVSADLEELAQTAVTVVCAGAKSILDLPRTLEYLETKGVPVIGYQTKVLPQFFTRDSDYNLNIYCDEINQIAKVIDTQNKVGLKNGILITNPIPQEYSMNKNYIESIIIESVKEAKKLDIKGKDITPFLLSKIVEKTDGKSLEANIQLVYNNAKICAQIAVEYQKLNCK